MKKILTNVFFLVFSILFLSCSRPNIEVIKAEFVEDIYVSGGQPLAVQGVEQQISVGKNGMWCKFKGHDIIKISLNFNYENLDIHEEIGSDEHRCEVYNILYKNAHLFDGKAEIKSIWGFWPEKVTETSASNMSLFYIIPKDTNMDKLRFEYETSILGKSIDSYTYSGFNKMKPLKLE
ncbi:MAG: hypothetical protein JXB00_17020 [Bacteroidales bacterium]|nr:hypothetical protein [Bacteroidales bacterium]